MPSESFDGISERLRNRAEKCDLRVQKLRQFAGKLPASEISLLLNCSERAVKCLAQRNGISLAIEVVPWSYQEEQYVRRNAQTMTMCKIAEVLGRSAISVKSFCQRKGISMMKHGERHHASIATDDEVEICRQLHESKMPLKVIARKMDFSVPLVRNIVYYRRS